MNDIENKKLQALQNMEKIKALEEEAKRDVGGSPDQFMLSHVLKDKQKIEEVNFVNTNINWDSTEKFKVALVILPAWSILFPPYSLAKLTGLLRHFGYSVKNYDINVEAYHYFIKEHGQDYWRTERYFLWENEENFNQYFLDDLKPLLDNVINEIISSGVSVVGFSLFSTNVFCSFYMAKRLRELNPNICLLAGGPETISGISKFKEGEKGYNLFNYIFVGESEDNLINILENLPTQLPLNHTIGSIESRLSLEAYPYSDYSDFNIRNYTQHGISLESSRGCVAKCTFCAETFFWKFRSQSAKRVVDEIEHYVKTYKVKRIWFVDSLINGNLKNFEEMVDLLRERKLEIKWHSMARCDGRMDLIFLRKVIASGCTALSFGVESGSEKVLLDMKKKINIWEIENNLRDTHKLGMSNHIHWQVGFPTEEPIDILHGFQLLYNARKWIGNISPGFGTGIAQDTPLSDNYKDYGIVGEKIPYSHDITFLNAWYTEEYKNTIIHRFLRVKLTHIWLEILKDHRGSKTLNTNANESLKDFYSLTLKKNKEVIEYLDRDFNVDLIQFKGSLSNSIANEYVCFCYVLYKYFNRFTFKIKCDPDADSKIFGNFLARNYKSEVYFDIDKSGNYILKIEHSLDHSTNEEYLQYRYNKEREYSNQSFNEVIEKTGNISEWQTVTPIVRETIHKQYLRQNS